MKALKEIEVLEKMQYRSKEEVDEKISQVNLYYPYTVKKLINSVYFQNYSVSIPDEDLLFLINSLESFCKCLHEFSEVTSFNISNVAMFIITNVEIQKEIYDGKIINLSERRTILSLKIKKALRKLDIKEINSDIEKNGIYVEPSKESNQELALIQGKELEKIFIDLIEKYNFAYSDILIKYILEVDLDYMMKFRTDYSNKNLRRNKHNFIVLLNSLNDLILKLHQTFKRDGLFLHKMLQLYLFSKNSMKEYIRQNLLIKDKILHTRSMRVEYGKSEFTLKEEMDYRNNDVLLRGFTDGLSHIKELYIIRFANFNNCNLSNFKGLSQDVKYNYLNEFCKDLNDESIYVLYAVHNIIDNEVFEYKDKLKLLKEDIDKKKKNISFVSQELTDENKNLVINIFDQLSKSKTYKTKDICLSNLKQAGRILELLSFKAEITKRTYSIILGKNNSNLTWRIYLDNKLIYREYCVCAEDLNRLFVILNKINNDYIFQEKYNLI